MATNTDVEEGVKMSKRRKTITKMIDLWYIENWSFKLDMQFIPTTIWQMVRGESKGA